MCAINSRLFMTIGMLIITCLGGQYSHLVWLNDTINPGTAATCSFATMYQFPAIPFMMKLAKTVPTQKKTSHKGARFFFSFLIKAPVRHLTNDANLIKGRFSIPDRDTNRTLMKCWPKLARERQLKNESFDLHRALSS